MPADANSAFRTVVVSNAQLQGTTGLQIEIRALRKLQHPVRSKKLESFLGELDRKN